MNKFNSSVAIKINWFMWKFTENEISLRSEDNSIKTYIIGGQNGRKNKK